jgi:hypothetical protein
MSRAAARQSSPRGHDQQLSRFHPRSQRFNRILLILGILRELREVMAERKMHHRIHSLRAASQAL